MQRPLKKFWKNNQKGSSLAMVAFSMTALMFAGGVVLDLGNLYAHKAHLQNVADSAALAGVSQFGGTQFDTVSYRLTEMPRNIDEDGSFSVTVDETEYHLFKDDDTDLPDRGAEVYVDRNTSAPHKLSLTEQKKKDATATQIWASRDENDNVNAVCYIVKLKDSLPTYFARFFGLETLTPEATAVAMAYIKTENKKIDEFIPEVAKNIAETIPNYYWESIVGNSFTVENTDTSIMDFKIKTTATDPGTFGYRKSAYFTDSWGNYIQDITEYEDFNKPNSGNNIIAYMDRDYKGKNENNHLIYDYSENTVLDKICAQPIYADDKVNKTSLATLKNLVYTLDADLMKKGKEGEITGLFLDRPNIGSSQAVRGTVLNITSDTLSNDTKTPLYMRFESEPIKFGGSPTFVQPITINVTGYQEKPMIIAYDGPDPNRTLLDAPKTDVINPGSAWAHNKERILETERLSSAAVSAPYTINLDADFNGVIYAPFSEVTITGKGKINGFVMAARINDFGTSSTRTKLTSNEVSLPIWGATHTGGNSFSYTVKYVKNNYSIAYDSLTYYTNSIVYKE